MNRARSKPVSPGIITSRISRSKCRPLSLARASFALIAVVTPVAFAAQKTRQQVADAAVVVDQQQMRRVVGRLRWCSCDGGSLGHIYSFVFPPEGVPKIASSTLSGSSRSIMARRNCLTASRPAGSMPRSARLSRSVCSPASFATSASPFGVAKRKRAGDRCCRPSARYSPRRAIASGHVRAIAWSCATRRVGRRPSVRDSGGRNAARGDAHGRSRKLELVIGVADEIPVGEKQKFDDVPAQCRGRHGRTCLVGLGAGRRRRA